MGERFGKSKKGRFFDGVRVSHMFSQGRATELLDLDFRPAAEQVLSQEAAGSDAVVHADRLPAQGTEGVREQGFLDLGFTFGKKFDQVMREATLPKGWKKVPSKEDPRHIVLVDGNDMVRGSVFIKNCSYDYYGSTCLYPEGSEYIKPFGG